MMVQHIFIDTVLQVFETDGNLHIIAGVSNGEIDLKGNDIIEKNLHITMPIAKALKIIPDIAQSLPKITENEPTKQVASENANDEFEGQGMFFKI